MFNPNNETSFILRLAVSMLGLWFVDWLFDSVTIDEGFMPIFITALVLAFVNSFLRPLFIVLSLPAVIVTLGIFMIFVNGFMLYIVDWLVSGIQIDGFGSTVLASVVLGLVNYILISKNQKNS